MSAEPDLYRVLHVQPDAPHAIIHASYRTLLQRAQANGSEDELASLDAAYAVLGDPEARTAYDRSRTRLRVAAPDGGESDDAPTAAGATGCLFCGTPHGLQRVLENHDECGHCASPLFAAERHRLEYSGQRMLNRIPKRRTVEVCVTWPQETPASGEMRDVSLNGMSFVAALKLELNQLVRIDCRELRALGRVAHTEPERDGTGRLLIGVEFLTLRFRQIRGTFVSAQA